MAIWALCAGPPDLDVGLGLDDNVAKVSIVGMIPLALQKWAEEADVWACLLIRAKSCGGIQSELRQTALYLKLYCKATAWQQWEAAVTACQEIRQRRLVQVTVLQQCCDVCWSLIWLLCALAIQSCSNKV